MTKVPLKSQTIRRTVMGNLFVDINECANAATNNCTESTTCLNSEGSYTCQCKTGYVQQSPYDCQGNVTDISTVMDFLHPLYLLGQSPWSMAFSMAVGTIGEWLKLVLLLGDVQLMGGGGGWGFFKKKI